MGEVDNFLDMFNASTCGYELYTLSLFFASFLYISSSCSGFDSSDAACQVFQIDMMRQATANCNHWHVDHIDTCKIRIAKATGFIL